MHIEIVTLHDRPDLVDVCAAWTGEYPDKFVRPGVKIHLMEKNLLT